MSLNRIQKLLFSEYCDFEDMVLIESPFAQTTRDGMGLRQIHLGLTPTKLVLATDILQKATAASALYIPGVDPEIETFELVAVYPIECVNLSIFHQKKRRTLKARFMNNKVLFFELGGFEKRNMFWNLWCEKVKFLSPDDPGSSYSETSVATSTSNSTLYIASTKHVINKKGTMQFWVEYGSGDHNRANPPKWTDKSLFVGTNEHLRYLPVMQANFSSEYPQWPKNKKCESSDVVQSSSHTEMYQNRFGKGVVENCNSHLFLPAENLILNKKFSGSSTESADMFTLYSTIPVTQSARNINFPEMAENCVRLWEYYKEATGGMRNRHRRRYALAPLPHFLHGLGPWNVSPGETFSVQMKRTPSLITIRRQPIEPELRLPVSRRQLIASISCEAIHIDERLIDNSNTIKTAPKRPVIFFWTPEYWYRPRSARVAYQELQNHLNKIRQYREDLNKRRKSYKKRFCKKRKPSKQDSSESDTSTDNAKVLCGQESSLQYLKRMVRLEVALTAWDFDSTTLAYQLTLIDRDLFLKIPPIELGVLIWQQSAKNAPNVGAFVAFSHRVSCLVASEVLRNDSEKLRARLIARFINMAEKCNRIANFQTCKSILNGLQSPSVFRLQETWSYVRKKHSTKYVTFEKLCRQYRDPRLQVYQEAFAKASRTVPFLPYVGDLFSKLLDRIPNYERNERKLEEKELPPETTKSEKREERLPVVKPKENKNLLKKLFFPFKNQASEEIPTELQPKEDVAKEKKLRVYSLLDYYKPLHVVEDNRKERLNEGIELLERYQRAAAHYVINRNELAREYLLKARYKEERDNFRQSLRTERKYESSTSYK